MPTPTSIARSGALLLAALALALTLDAPRDAEALPPLADGFIDTVAGTGEAGFNGDGGPATDAQLKFPNEVALDAAGNLFIADSNNDRIRRVDAATNVIATVAGGGTAGLGDGGPATDAELSTPVGVALDAAGNLYIADTFNSRIRRVDAATNVITTVAGTGIGGFGGDGGPAADARLSLPFGVALDADGNLFIADLGNHRIRRVDAVTHVITTVAGGGTSGLGDGGPATDAQLSFPIEVALDAAGNLFIADSNHDRIRRVDALTNVITTVAGGGTSGPGDGGPATDGQLGLPTGIAVDAAGNLFIADEFNSRIRRVDALTGLITTVAGTGIGGFGGDGGPATDAQLHFPAGVATDAAGNLFIADSLNQRVRRVAGVAAIPPPPEAPPPPPPDADGDGLLDNLELLFGTDPFAPDTDGDGRSDADELFLDNTDPRDPTNGAGVEAPDDPPEERVPFTPAPASSGGTLTAYAGGSLQQLIEDLQAAGQTSATVTLDGTRVTLIVTTHRVLRIEATTNATTVVPAGTLMFVRALE